MIEDLIDRLEQILEECKLNPSDYSVPAVLGKGGTFTSIMREIRDLPVSERELAKEQALEIRNEVLSILNGLSSGEEQELQGVQEGPQETEG